ncbi:ribose 5-phosphate isomerase A [Pedobacter sp. PAMC26386]|nr:ribose 5-phosphate isomerase A [Pedobacter sp. PAMC26386]
MDKYIKFSPDTNLIEMIDYKMEAAKASLNFIKAGQTIGLGAGSTIVHLMNLISENVVLAASLTFVSSSFKTRAYLLEKGLNVKFSNLIAELDTYFDGCDQFDSGLNALKSGGGIHTSEKILASMAAEFILMGDESKMVSKLDHTYPLVVEILQEALPAVLHQLKSTYPDAVVKLRLSNQKDGALISDNGNLLADIYFTELPELQELNVAVKMIPGIVDHSLFFGMATKAVIAGEKGIKILIPA